jgi:hypothetical protein
MNYLKVYCNLIRKAENRTLPEGYTEKHHTFPVSIFGKNNRVVVLTAREHYIAHALLEKAFIKRYGLKHWKTIKMTWAHSGMKGNGGYINSYLYEGAKKRRSESMKGKPWYIPNENHKENARKRRLGTKATEETKKKMSEAHIGKKLKPFSEEHKERLRGKRPNTSGENHPFYGKTLSPETRAKISAANIGRKLSPEHKEKLSLARKGKQMKENNGMCGKFWITDGTLKNNKVINNEEKIPDGWYKGRVSSTGKNKWWVNNEGITKFQQECPGVGWKRGRRF